MSSSSSSEYDKSPTWTPIRPNPRFVSSNANQTVDFDQLTTFNFRDKQTVVKYEPIWNGKFSMILKGSSIWIVRDNEKFTIDKFNVASIVISANAKSLEIFLCLHKPSTYRVNDDLYPFDYTNRTFNLCMKRLTPYNNVKLLKNIFSGMTTEAFQVSNIVEIQHDYNQPDPMSSIDDYEKFCLISEWHAANATALPAILPEEIVQKLMSIESNQLLEYVLTITEVSLFKKVEVAEMAMKEFKLTEFDSKSDDNSGDKHPAKFNYFRVACVRITPHRIIVQPMKTVPQNRVYRYYPNTENFVSVEFANEYDDSPWKSNVIARHFENIADKGFKVAGKTYNFVGCSNSQLRESRCWFTCLNRQEVYDRIGDFSLMENPGRKLTRLGLAFSASVETVEVNLKYLQNPVDDIINDRDVNFSDGIGTGSQELFERISTIMGLDSIPSAFQIRIGGIKGVISRNDQKEELIIRKSMKKFESSHNIIEVLNESSPIPLYLNRHVILMLSSYGIHDDVFLDMQQADLSKYRRILASNKSSDIINFTKSYSTCVNWDAMPMSVSNEPIMRQVLIYQTIDLVSELTNHAGIFVENGRLLMGVLDETGTLKYGEIYAHIKDDKIDMTLSGDVIVFRNPSVLKSDIRKLRARKNVPKHFKSLYKNVIVMPAKGPDSHANECAGGDLDGDLYCVIWDKKLIPSNLKIPGREVVRVDTKQMAECYDGGSIRDMINFYCNYQQKNCLGVIANAHLAVSDQCNIESNAATNIARYVVAETDAPKKGYTVKDDYKKLIPKEYPHYMRKVDRKNYTSETIVGKLFDESLSVLDIITEGIISDGPKNCPMLSRYDETSVDYWYSLYCCQLMSILKSFKLSSEADLFSGCPIWDKDFRTDYRNRTRIRQTLEDRMKAFWKQWLVNFEIFRDRVHNDTAKMTQWYMKPKYHELSPATSFSLLALPYMNQHNGLLGLDFKSKVQLSLIKWTGENLLTWLAEWNLRHHIGEKIYSCLNDPSFDFYGSSLLMLFEDFSDIDMYTSRSLQDCAKVLQALDRKATEKNNLHLSYVKVALDSHLAHLTNSKAGVRQMHSIAMCFDENPDLWPPLRLLLEWARTNMIVKSGMGQNYLQRVFQFVMLFIEISTGSPVKPSNKKQPITMERVGRWIQSSSEGQNSAKLIGKFLDFLSHRENHNLIASMKNPMSQQALIRADDIGELRKKAESALFILAAHNGNVEKLLQLSVKSKVIKINNKYLDPKVKNNCDVKEMQMSVAKEAGVERNRHINLELIVKGQSYYVVITGSDHRAFLQVEKTLHSIQEKAIASKTFKSKENSNYLLNAALIIPEFSHGVHTDLTFSVFNGDNCQPQHVEMLKAVMNVDKNRLNGNWRVTEYSRYKKKFLKQLQEYQNARGDDDEKFKGTEKWRLYGKMKCMLRIGDHYFFRIPESLITSQESLKLEKVEQTISSMGAHFSFEKADQHYNAIMNINQSSSMSSLVSRFKKVSKKPVQLIPLQHQQSREEYKKEDKNSTTTNGKNFKSVNDIRNTFATSTKFDGEMLKIFADDNEFTLMESSPTRVDITASWRNGKTYYRNWKVTTDNHGVLRSVHHQKSKWLSTTLKQFEKTEHDDVRIYLETRQEPDGEEKCLDNLQKHFDNKCILNKKLVDFINRADAANAELPSKPLNYVIMKLGWKFDVIRVVKCVAVYKNSDGDVITLNEIRNGSFDQKAVFQWMGKHNELEVEMNMTNRSNEEICRDSFDMGLKLFDFIK